MIDLETTGGSADDCAITEIGAVKVRGGAKVGAYQTLVNPGCAIPPAITVLTGITESLVTCSPRIEAVLPSLVDFIADSVIVGHNVRFDMSFLQAALRRDRREPLTNPTIDTVALARRLVRDEVPNCRLETLAARLRLDHRPSHRALDDALATADLLHVLIDRATGLGVSGLDDLRALPTLVGSAHAAKLHLTERLPRAPGVYLFRDGNGAVLYVGKATNLRARVRQYFAGDDRRKVAPLLRETQRIDHKRCGSEIEAAVIENRLIHHLEPRYNQHGTRAGRAAYVRFTAEEAFPRLSVVRRCRTDGSILLGPMSSSRAARAVVEAIHTVAPLRRCEAPVDRHAYARAAQTVLEGLTTTPSVLVDPLWDRMERLAAEDRFEEAAETRDALRALLDALARQRRIDQLRAVPRLVVHRDDGGALELRRGRLTAVIDPNPAGTLGLDGGWRGVEAVPDDPGSPQRGPVSPALAAEILLISRWLERDDHRPRLVEAHGQWASPARWVAQQATMLRTARR